MTLSPSLFRTASLNSGMMAAFVAVDSTQSLTVVGYLVVFGSWVGLSAYVWRLDVGTRAQVFIYNYENRVVAVLLAYSKRGAN